MRRPKFSDHMSIGLSSYISDTWRSVYAVSGTLRGCAKLGHEGTASASMGMAKGPEPICKAFVS